MFFNLQGFVASDYGKSESTIDRLKRVYFSEPSSRRLLKKGDVLVSQGMYNDTLFLVISGKVIGKCCIDEPIANEASGRCYEMFRGSTGTFIGVHSFFSEPYLSFFTVEALTDVEVAVLKRNTLPVELEKYGSLQEQFLPMISNELALRNFHLLEMSVNNEQALNRLHRSELNASLGQLAAGIAHELNNAIGVIARKSDFIAEALEHIIETRIPDVQELFHQGQKYNEIVSTEIIRDRTRRFEKKWKLSHTAAKVLARMVNSEEEAELLGPEALANFEKLSRYWELGHDLRDVRLAANHAADIVKSVRSLGGNNFTRTEGLSIHETLSRAISLLKPSLHDVKLEADLGSAENAPLIYGDMTELVQIWVNIIKNSCDAMEMAETKDPKVSISCSYSSTHVSVKITDNGPGISNSAKDKIFQMDFTTKKNGLSFGLGLGLAIVHRIVDSYGGKIILDSVPQKTTFNITLPIENNYGNN